MSSKTDDAILERVHGEIQDFMKEKFEELGEECERYVILADVLLLLILQSLYSCHLVMLTIVAMPLLLIGRNHKRLRFVTFVC